MGLFRFVIYGVTVLLMIPIIFSILYFAAGYYIAGIAAVACAPAILWVLIIGWRHAKFRMSLNIDLYSSSGAPQAAGETGGYGYSSQGSGQQQSGLCRSCDTPLSPSSPICPKCGRKN